MPTDFSVPNATSHLAYRLFLHHQQIEEENPARRGYFEVTFVDGHGWSAVIDDID